MTKKLADIDFNVVVVEQLDDKAFNRGKLINIGFLETKSDIIAAHDVDILLESSAYHSNNFPVNQLCKSEIQTDGYLGGVTIYQSETFAKVGGYHNEYYHRAEDNEMRFHLRRNSIQIVSYSCKRLDLPHPRTGPEFIPELWQKAQLPRTINMLETCKYELISKEVYTTHTHLKVLL